MQKSVRQAALPITFALLLVVYISAQPTPHSDNGGYVQGTVVMPGSLSESQTAAADSAGESPLAPEVLPQFIEITESCGPYYEGSCLNIRSAPNASSSAVMKIRAGAVLQTSGIVRGEDQREWFKIVFNEWLRYPERADGDMYVAAEYVRAFTDTGAQNYDPARDATTTKHILVDRSDQKLYAYDGEVLFMETPISTGLELTPTPRGYFHIYRKTPSRYMQGPLPGISDQFYDLPGVPYNLYFTNEGGAIHGAYWHDHFGEQWSHGCVNLPVDKARELYAWAPLGAQVLVRD